MEVPSSPFSFPGRSICKMMLDAHKKSFPVQFEMVSWLPGVSPSLLKRMMKSEYRERSHIILFTLVSQ